MYEMFLITNRTVWINQQRLQIEACLFLMFWNTVIVATANTLFAQLIQPPEGDGKVLHSNGPHGPFPRFLQALLVKIATTQLLLHSFTKKSLLMPDPVNTADSATSAGCCGWRSSSRHWQLCSQVHRPSGNITAAVPNCAPLLPQMPQEGVQDRDNIVYWYIYIYILMDWLWRQCGCKWGPCYHNRHDYLLGLTGMNHCIYRARLSLFHPLLWLLLCLRCMVANHDLIHCHNPVHHHTMDSGDEFTTDSDSFFRLFFAEQPGSQSCCFLF